MTEIGSVSPVITVERQLWRNRNTIATVKIAPSSRSSSTCSTDARMKIELSITTSSNTSCGRSLRSSAIFSHCVGNLDGVLSRLLANFQRDRLLDVELFAAFLPLAFGDE